MSQVAEEVHMVAFCVFQAQHDYLQGHYPVNKEDAAQMCAHQMQAEAVPVQLDSDLEALDAAVERFIVGQVGHSELSFQPSLIVLLSIGRYCSSQDKQL